MKTIITGKRKFNSTSQHIVKLQFKNCVKTKSEPKSRGIFKSITGNEKKRHREKRVIVCVTAKPSGTV
jgi:thioredoxin reductase